MWAPDRFKLAHYGLQTSPLFHLHDQTRDFYVYNRMIYHRLRSENSLEIGLPKSWEQHCSFRILSYCLTEEVGEMWRLQSQWLSDQIPNSLNMEKTISIQRENTLWIGYVVAWKCVPFSQGQWILDLEVEPHHPHLKRIELWKSIPRQRGIRSLLQDLGFEISQWSWSRELDEIDTPNQWLLLNESAWNCLQRYLERIEYQCTWFSDKRQFHIHPLHSTPKKSKPISFPIHSQFDWDSYSQKYSYDWTVSTTHISLGDSCEKNMWIQFRKEQCSEVAQQIGIGEMTPLQCQYKASSSSKKKERAPIRGGYWGQILEQNANIMNAQGQYNVRILNAIGKPTDAICYHVSRIQPQSHAEGGLHIPLLTNSTVFLLFSSLNPDEPFLVGSHPTWGGCKSPVTDQNSSESIWNTPLGMKLSIMDSPNPFSAIQFQTPNGFFWNYNDEKKELQFGFENSHILLSQQPASLKLQVHESKLQLMEDKIKLSSTKQMECKSPHFQVKCTEDISITANQTVEIQSNQIQLNSL